MTTDANATATEAAVRAVLDEAEAALRAADWPRYSSVWAHEPWIELLHPAEGEWLTGWDAVGPGYEALIATGARLEIERRRLHIRVAPAGRMAWAVAETVLRLASDAAPATVLWTTYVLEELGGSWRLVHGHVSVSSQVASPDPVSGTARGAGS